MGDAASAVADERVEVGSWWVLFVEVVDEANRQRFEVTYNDPTTGVQVHPQFVQLGIDEQALS